MKKKKPSLIIVLIVSLVIVNIAVLKSAEATITTETLESNNLSIILMIGDGMGFEHLKLAKWAEKGPNQNLSLETFPIQLSVITDNIYGEITDSAASGTAIATGNKTANKKIAMSIIDEPLETILELMQKQNKSTGIVTTTSIQHATPACFMTHESNRNNYAAITEQIVNDVEVNILLGGGKDQFSTAQLEAMTSKGYQLSYNKTSYETLVDGNILGLFADSHLPYESVKDFNQIPTLAAMTEKTIDYLAQDPDGFFLMVEGGRIDHAGHANNKEDIILETVAFLHAVNRAYNFAKNNPNVLLLVTADHETGGLSVLSENLDTTVPLFGNSLEENRTLLLERAADISVSFSTSGHTSTHVPLYGYGTIPANYTTKPLIDNTQIYDIMRNYTLNLPTTIPEEYTYPYKDRNAQVLIVTATIIAIPMILVIVIKSSTLIVKRKRN